jgi:ATP-dependent 26S proteasome regulatory subunit
MLAKAVCNMKKAKFFNCSTAFLVSKYRGDSEKILKCLFQVARAAAPAVIFMDEIDATELMKLRALLMAMNTSSLTRSGMRCNRNHSLQEYFQQ